MSLKFRNRNAFLFATFFLLLVFLTGCSSGCPPTCLGERIGAVDWSGNNLRNVTLIQAVAQQSNLNNVDFTGADLSGIDLNGSNMKSCNLTDAVLIGANLSGAHLSGTIFTRSDLTGADLSDADLTGVVLISSKLNAVDFSKTRLVNANMSQLNLAGSTMDGAKMAGSNLNRANLAGALLDKADLSGANLAYADLSGIWINLSTMVAANLQGANLSGASLIGTDLTGCNLSGASLAGANLLGAVLRGADLRGADLRSALLVATPALLDREKIDDAVIKDMSESQWEKLGLGDTDLDGALYDSLTRWPAGYIPPVGVIYQPVRTGNLAGLTPDALVIKQITVAGSKTVSNFAIPLSRTFISYHPNVDIKFDVTDSSSGISQVGSGSVDIGMSSRPLRQAEKDQYRDGDIHMFLVANDSIAVVNNLSNKVGQITIDQLRSIYAGKIVNWKELGGADLQISLLAQDNTLMDFFTANVMGGMPIADNLVRHLPSDPTVRAAVSSEQGSLGLLPKKLVDNSVKSLALNDAQPISEANDPQPYLLIRPLYLITRGEPSVDIRAWIDFIMSDESRQEIILEGLEPGSG